MKNCKTIYETQAASRLQEIIQPSPNPPLSKKMSLRLWEKFFYKDIQKYTNIFFESTSKMLFLGVKKWCSANAFSDIKQKHVYWEILKVRQVFCLYCESILFSMSSESRSVEWIMFCERNFIVKWVMIFASFCWLWEFLPENLKLKRNTEDAGW